MSGPKMIDTLDRARKIAHTFATDIAGATLTARLAGRPMSECVKALRITANMIERDNIDVHYMVERQ